MRSQPVLLSAVSKQITWIPVEKIRESIITLRTEYDVESLDELGESLIDQGQLQTIVVQLNDDGFYDLVIGSRRTRAARHKGIRDIAAFVIEKRSPVQLLMIALAENLHRSDLNPFEEAQGFLKLNKEFGLSLKEIAKGVNKPEEYIRNRFQLLSMPEDVIKMVSDRTLPLTSVRTLARVPTGQDQVRLAKTMVRHHLTQSELSAQVRQELEEAPRKERESYELTSVKVSAKVADFMIFLQKVPRRLKMHSLNAQEKQAILKSLESLGNQASTLHDIISKASVTAVPRSLKAVEPDNHYQEWTVQEIKRINSPNRPSDDILSIELGRTVSSIKNMRSKTAE